MNVVFDDHDRTFGARNNVLTRIRRTRGVDTGRQTSVSTKAIRCAAFILLVQRNLFGSQCAMFIVSVFHTFLRLSPADYFPNVGILSFIYCKAVFKLFPHKIRSPV